MPVLYLTLEMVLDARRMALEASDSVANLGGDLGSVQSILEHMQNDRYYPELEDKIAHLFFGLTKGHCFADGNKRTAVTATLYMLLLNGLGACSQRFLEQTEEIVVHVAANRIDKPLLRDLLAAIVKGTYEDDEGLKTRHLAAITDIEG